MDTVASAPATIENVVENNTKKRRSRVYEPKGLDIIPYRKKPKLICSDFLPLDHPSRKNIPHSFETPKNADVIWMLNHHVSPAQAPWVGWNSKIFKDKQEIQKVWYMRQINESPTSTAVVAETLNGAQKIAKEKQISL